MAFEGWVPEWVAATFEDVSYWMEYNDCVAWSDLVTSKVAQEDLAAFMMEHILESDGVDMRERYSVNPRQ
jgi:hypothetical protein